MANAKKAFILMPFSPPFDSYYPHIFKPALEAAGFSVSRADDLFTPRPIMLDIQQSIVQADLILCEMSGRNPNVFYELGLAHAIGKPAILLSQNRDDIPFDFRHIRVILYDYKAAGWESKLRDDIQRAAESAIGSPDPWPPPIMPISFLTSTHDAIKRFFLDVNPITNDSTLLPNLCPAPTSHRHISSPDVVALFAALGVLRISNGRVECVSESAEAFLASLWAHFLDGSTRYFGDWSAVKTEEERKLVTMLSQWEAYRIRSTHNARPSRSTNAAVALIRADLDGQPMFIMLYNRPWRRWWFVGSEEETQDDKDLTSTVVRGVCQKLKHQREKIVEPHSLGTAPDKTISERVGLYTEYFYKIFAVQLVDIHPKLLRLKGRIDTVPRIEEFKWFAWDKILNLLDHAKLVVEELRKIRPESIPKSGDLLQN